MYLINQVHLVARTRRVGDVFEQFTGLFDFRPRGRIDLDQIEKATGIDVLAGRTNTTRGGADAFFAVEALSEYACDGGLADTAGAGKHIGVVQTVIVERVGQRAENVLLTDHIFKTMRPPFARQYLIAHRPPLSEPKMETPRTQARSSANREASRTSHIPAPEIAAAAAPFRA